MKTDDIKFKANRFRFLKIHLVGACLCGVLSSILHEGSILYFLFTVFTLSVVVIPILLLIDTTRYDIVLKQDGIEGPVRRERRLRRITVPYELIDLVRSRKFSFLRSGFIATKDAHRMYIHSLYLSMSQENRIFDELNRRCHGIVNHFDKGVIS